MASRWQHISAGWLTAGLLVLILCVRIAGIIVSPLNLGPDEAQYWRWGQEFALGYYSKPPLIAWVIGLFTGLFGDAEWVVRLPAPFLHTGAAGALYFLARDMYTPRIAAYSALVYCLMPGVVLSSGLMTTDGLLLPLWSLGLLALWRLRAAPESWRLAALLGAAIGLGFLAKYAMIYFLIGTGLVGLFDLKTRHALLSRYGALAAFTALIVVSPHLLWSAASGFETLEHTADNANWGGPLFHPEHAVKFLVDQMGIFGPAGFTVLLAILVVSVIDQKKSRHWSPMTWLICFCLPPLLIILSQAVLSRAHANWAATAYPAGSVLLAAWLCQEEKWATWRWVFAGGLTFIAALYIPKMALSGRVGIGLFLSGMILAFGLASTWQRKGLLWVNFAINGVAAAVFMAMAAGPANLSEKIGLADVFKRTRGWQMTMAQLRDLSAEHGAVGLMFDERENWHGADYYNHLAGTRIPLYMWQRNASPKSYAETFALPVRAEGAVLVAAKSQFLQDRIYADFATVQDLGVLDIPLAGGATRRFRLYLASGHTPRPRTNAWRETVTP